MVAWDLASDPVWATIVRAWVWRDGGVYFGVPLSNFFGWYLNVYILYQLVCPLLTKARPAGDTARNHLLAPTHSVLRRFGGG
jgi:uncharacterized membrane protein